MLIGFGVTLVIGMSLFLFFMLFKKCSFCHKHRFTWNVKTYFDSPYSYFHKCKGWCPNAEQALANTPCIKCGKTGLTSETKSSGLNPCVPAYVIYTCPYCKHKTEMKL